ncbi:uncharacterized protein N7496_004291 [Penicillium cataractarum]|uniref:Uncharacterized protein n=1 Tax=Penicillium cataractarum TaxID=2100454 RepID=A0A9W9VGZ8_9EURO|nr:uncharacterized protein N7496_004291 [Penicillium cataractarum]KAJ5381863.1 hypothetical protein N7496_004291 [Penicillium cataractarum]
MEPLSYISWWDTRSRLAWRSLINSLLQAGLSPDRKNYHGVTPADNIIENFGHVGSDLERQQMTIDISSDLLKAGGYMTREALDWRHRENVFNPSYYCSGWCGRRNDELFEDFSFRLIWRLADEKGLQDIDLPEELQPLVYKSKKLLASQLRKGVDFNRWIKSYTRWAPGLALILQSSHISTEGVLTAACEANCEESVRILIDDYKCFIGNEEFEIASFHPNPTIVDLIVNGFIDRRKRLQTLAEAHLPSRVADKLNTQSHILLNFHAYEVYTLLQRTSANLEGLLERHPWSVFDCIGVNIDLADRLWNGGFRDVDEVDNDNETCLTRIWSTTPPCSLEVLLQKAHWLISKGADVHHRKSSESALYVLGNSVGQVLYEMSEKEKYALKCGLEIKIRPLSEASKTLLTTILSDNTRDDCDCACSPSGCSPLTGFLSGLFSMGIHKKTTDLIQVLVGVLRAPPFDSNYAHDERFKSHLSTEILRFITFQSLEISHTCLHKYRKFEPEEIKEIQDEEKLLILDLKRLLTQSLEKLKGYGGQLPSFITTMWRTQMTSFLSTPRTYSADEISEIVDGGVIIENNEI